MAFTLPDLPYSVDALEPHVDAKTMEIHHGKHHAAYVKKLNDALAQHPDLQTMSIEDLLGNLKRVPENIRATVRNNGGGHANHSLFWQVVGPRAGGEPGGSVADAIKSSFGSFDAFRAQFSKAAEEHFGSGWVWVTDRHGQLAIEETPNQDTPLMEGRTPVFGLDLWEHAYYLKYQNRRTDYIKAWWNVVNWTAINKQLERHAAGVAK